MTPIAYIVCGIFGMLCWIFGFRQGQHSMDDAVEGAWRTGFDCGTKSANMNRAIAKIESEVKATRIPLPPDTPSARAPASPGSAAA